MVAQIPSIHVYNIENVEPVRRQGTASKIAVIGAFNTEETNPKIFADVDTALETFGSDSTFNGCSVIKDLFIGASSLLCVNTTTWTGTGAEKTANKELTTQKLSDALAKIKGEDFDILFVAETLTSTAQPIITAFLDSMFEMKYPCGYTAALGGANVSENVAFATNAGNHCYGLITQTGTFDGVDKTLLQTAARYTGIIAGMNVGNTMTMKVVPNLTAVNPELSFETGGNGKSYVEAGITTFKCQDREASRFVVVNSEQPNGYDLYINRVRDYVVKEMSLHQFLGERNRTRTHNEIDHELSAVRDKCVNSLDLLEDINYVVNKKDANCVDIRIESLVFAGIITRIDVYINIKVE